MAEQDKTPDADLQLKKRARRRLVGAAALALLAVIVLPMVMDREPRPLSQDIQVRIPSQETGGLASKLLPGKPASTPLPTPAPKQPASTQPVADTKAEPKPETKTEAKPKAEAVAVALAVPKPAVAPVAVPTAKPAEKPAENPAEKPATPEKKEEPAEKPVAKPAGDASAQWVVQLGAYKEASNVKVMLAKLKGLGVPAYTENFDSPQGARTRVRAGPFASQDAAEKARTRIKIIGVDGPVAPK
jgi:DedD protein